MTPGERRAISFKPDLSAFDEVTANAIRAHLREEVILCRDGCRVILLRQDESGELVAVMTRSGYGSNPHLLLVEPGSEKAITQRAVNGKLIHEYEGLDGAPDADGEVELRPFTGQQVYIDGKPVGDPFK